MNVNYALCYLPSGSINAALAQLSVRNAAPAEAEARLLLLVSARHTLAAGMILLGLTPLHRM